jgi:hypothetical protein
MEYEAFDIEAVGLCSYRSAPRAWQHRLRPIQLEREA